MESTDKKEGIDLKDLNISNQSKVDVLEQSLKIAQIEEIFKNITSNITFSKGKNIIAVIGPTKAGKSTLINCLMSNRLLCRQNLSTEEICIVSAGTELGPVIGISGESETSIPKEYSNLTGTDWPIWDFPGFGDNKGTEQEIANAAAYGAVLAPQSSVRFVLVVPVELIKSDNPMQFFKLLNDIVMICPDVTKSVCIVATKSDKGTVLSWLKKAKGGKFNNANKENSKIISNAIHVIDCVLESGNFIDFKAPVMEKDCVEREFKPENLSEIIELIQRLRGCAVSNLPLVISDQAKHEILTLYTIMYNELSTEIGKTCQLIDNHFNTNIEETLKSTDDSGKPTSSAVRLQLFKQGKGGLVAILNKTTNVRDFFAESTKRGFQVETLEENVTRFAFVEKIQNMYTVSKSSEKRGEEEFFTRIKLILNVSAQKYSDLISSAEFTSAEEKRLEEEWKKQANEEMTAMRIMVSESARRNAESLTHLTYAIQTIARPPPRPSSSSSCSIQ